MPPIWQDAHSAVWCGDNAQVMAEMFSAGLRFDLIGPTSPPYNLAGGTRGGDGNSWVDTRLSRLRGEDGSYRKGTLYGTHNDNMPMDEYIAWQREFTRQAFELLTEDGALAYQHKPRIIGRHEIWPTEYIHPDLAPYRRQTVILDRKGGMNFNPGYYVPSYEVLLIYARPKWRLREGGWAATSVWVMPAPREVWHPAPFVKALPNRLIGTVECSLVLDPFLGSGTTLIAARELGVQAHGIEIHQPFAERAAQEIASTQVGMLPASKMSRTRQREAAAAQGGLFGATQDHE